MEHRREAAKRIAQYLKTTWPTDTVKEVARAFDVQPRTAKDWISGEHPRQEKFYEMVGRWGSHFLNFVTEPITGEGEDAETILQRIAADIETLRQGEYEYEATNGRKDLRQNSNIVRAGGIFPSRRH